MEHWIITIKDEKGNTTSTAAINGNPVDWLIKYGRGRPLIFAMPVSKEQYEKLEEAGYQ